MTLYLYKNMVAGWLILYGVVEFRGESYLLVIFQRTKTELSMPQQIRIMANFILLNIIAIYGHSKFESVTVFWVLIEWFCVSGRCVGWNFFKINWKYVHGLFALFNLLHLFIYRNDKIDKLCSFIKLDVTVYL